MRIMVSQQFFCLFTIILQHFRDSTINSEKTFSLHWLTVKGEHYYIVKAYTLLGGQKFIEDTKGGSFNIGTNDGFSGILSVNVTSDVSTGTRVRFALNVKNVENAPRHSVPVRVYYVYTSPDGKWHDAIKVKEAEVNFDPLGEYQDWFNFNFENPGTYDFYLMVNGQEKEEKTIKVNAQGSISAVMTCNPEFVSEGDDSVTCNVTVTNLNNTPINTWITDAYFAGGKIYDSTEGNNLVVPDPSSLALNPGSSGTFTFTIPINDELQERVPVDLSNINLGTPIAVKAYLNTLKEPVMYVIQMNPRNLGGNIHVSSKDAISVVVGVGKAVWSTAKENPKSVMTVVSSIGEFAYTAGISWIIQTWAELYWRGLTEPLPPDNHGDNNLIVGDES